MYFFTMRKKIKKNLRDEEIDLTTVYSYQSAKVAILTNFSSHCSPVFILRAFSPALLSPSILLRGIPLPQQTSSLGDTFLNSSLSCSWRSRGDTF
jgi:hypothetical protein